MENDRHSRCGDTDDDRNSDDPQFSYRRTSDGEKRTGGKSDHQDENGLGSREMRPLGRSSRSMKKIVLAHAAGEHEQPNRQ